MCVRNLISILRNQGHRLFQESQYGNHHAVIMRAIRGAIMGIQRLTREDADLCFIYMPGQVFLSMEMLKNAVRTANEQIGVMVMYDAPTQDAAADGCRMKLMYENRVN